jgi:hypothetical protein
VKPGQLSEVAGVKLEVLATEPGRRAAVDVLFVP